MTTTNHLTLPSPAKLNLMLHITGQREDGYHDLQTLFQFINYGDELSFEVLTDSRLELISDLAEVATEDNLIMRAAKLLQEQAPSESQYGARITLNKKLPMGGGLGGGSSNAATTLLALNHLWKLDISTSELQRLGLTLGADVPVFIGGQAAFAEGVGDRLTFVDDLEEPWYLVICPSVHVSTAQIFSHPRLTRNSPAINMRTALKHGGRNDCQAIVEELYPKVGNALKLLNKFSFAKLTGTGACVFARFSSEMDAHSVSNQLPAELSHFVAKGCNTSPTHNVLFSSL